MKNATTYVLKHWLVSLFLGDILFLIFKSIENGSFEPQFVLGYFYSLFLSVILSLIPFLLIWLITYLLRKLRYVIYIHYGLCLIIFFMVFFKDYLFGDYYPGDHFLLFKGIGYLLISTIATIYYKKHHVTEQKHSII